MVFDEASRPNDKTLYKCHHNGSRVMVVVMVVEVVVVMEMVVVEEAEDWSTEQWKTLRRGINELIYIPQK